MRRVRVVSTQPNVTPGRFLLIAGEDGEPWCAAAQELAADTNVPLDAVRTGHLDGDLCDSRCAWLRHRQIHTDGAILVRPDRRGSAARARHRTQPDPRPPDRRGRPGWRGVGRD